MWGHNTTVYISTCLVQNSGFIVVGAKGSSKSYRFAQISLDSNQSGFETPHEIYTTLRGEASRGMEPRTSSTRDQDVVIAAFCHKPESVRTRLCKLIMNARWDRRHPPLRIIASVSRFWASGLLLRQNSSWMEQLVPGKKLFHVPIIVHEPSVAFYC